jgi:3-oxoadipate enol-lactonase
MFIQVRGQFVHTVAYGDGAPAVVGVSGAFGNNEIWEQPFELLSRHHRVIAYDHFGVAETRVPAELVTFEEQVAVLYELLDALGVERCILAGDSNMAAVAVELAIRHPERVQALAIVAGGVVHQEDPLTTAFVDGLRSDFQQTIKGFVKLCIPEADSQHMRGWLSDIIGRTGGERAAALIESFYGIDLTLRLPQLSVPTVVIQGEKDALPSSNIESARAMAAAIPNCKLELLSGAGHVPTLTRPKEVADIIERLANSSSA